MAHSGRWQQIIPKNLTLFTKTGFRIVEANHSFFKLPVNLSKNVFFSVNPGLHIFGEQSDGTFWALAMKNAQQPHTFDKSWIQDCVSPNSLFKLIFENPLKNLLFL